MKCYQLLSCRRMGAPCPRKPLASGTRIRIGPPQQGVESISALRFAAALAALVFAVGAAFAWWAWVGRPVALVDAPGGRFPCVSYAPYKDGQTPFDLDWVVSPAQIEDDLRQLAKVTDCVRTYAVRQGLAEVVPVAAGLGMKVLLGVWINAENEKNRGEVETAIELARRYPETVAAVVVGNEVLLRGEQPPERLAAFIREVRAAVPPSVEVTYADVWEFWLKHPEIADAVDFITIHTLPYWEDDPVGIDKAVPHVVAIVDRVKQAFPGRRLLVGEAGWPSAGRMREGAQPSRVNQARFVRELIVAAEQDAIGLNVIEAFDQPWKRELEGTVGGHWGLFDEDRREKFPLVGPVREDGDWLWHFAAAAVLGVLLVLPAARIRRRATGGGGTFAGWLGLAVAGQAAATLLVAAGLAAFDAVRTPYDAFVWGGRGVLAAAVAVLVPVTLAGGAPVAPVAARRLIEAVRRGARPTGSPLALGLGIARLAVAFGAAVTTLCFLFDARYRDFPVALTLVPAVAFLVLTLARRRRNDSEAPGDLAEERLLAVVLAAGGIAIGLSEAPANVEAWGLMLANLLLAAALWLEPRRPVAAAAGDQARKRAMAPARRPAPANSGA